MNLVLKETDRRDYHLQRHAGTSQMDTIQPGKRIVSYSSNEAQDYQSAYHDVSYQILHLNLITRAGGGEGNMLLVHRHQNIILNFNDAIDRTIEEELPGNLGIGTFLKLRPKVHQNKQSITVVLRLSAVKPQLAIKTFLAL